ncbi:hypothetical protein [Bradyrhizobium australafricanum]|uniref:hypothetical protein n=1 Tax=Bradyrhizobium australafricanum TaxID=2821406 RepID=UPI001CE26222|nr:hypothetical protein [Bradyrhizobium australafricanum]MCA6098868.1 hypothetical protein [Bradyrhizobium australafricanum]
MAVPALRIPFGLDTQGFEKSIGEAKSLTSSATDFVVKEFAKMQLKSNVKLLVNSDGFKPAVQNATKLLGDAFDAQKPRIQAFTQEAVKETAEAGLKVASVFASPAIKGSFQAFTAVGVPAVVGLAQSLAPLALRAFAVYEAMHLMGDAINAARDQIAAMVAVADKAANMNVTPQFLQLFEGEARKLKVTTDELDGALSNAFSATKDKSPIDLSKWEVAKERITDVEFALRVYNQELAKPAGTQLQGLVLFRDAQTQEDKVRAILQAMIELDKIGQHTASLDIGEKMFGSQFVDRIRQGKTSAESILATVNDLKKSQDGIFSDELVARAKAIDDQLKLSQERLSRSLKPSWDELASVILTIKGYWADVIGLIAQAVELSNKIKFPSLSSVRDAALGAAGSIPVVGALATGVKLGIDNLPDRPATFSERFGNLPPAQTQQPSRGTGGAPTLKSTGGADKFDTSVESIEKRTAALQAEAAALDLGTEARERAKVAAQLETVAKQANAAAGLGENVVTAEQRKVIDQVAAAYGNAALAMQKAKVASDIGFGKQTAFLTPEDVQIAQQLRGQYNSVAESLNSVEASGLRALNAMKDLSNLGQEINRGFMTDFVQQIRNGASAMDALKTAASNALGKIADKLAQMAADNLWNSAFGGGGGGVNLFSLFGGGKASNATDGIGGFGPTVPAYASGTDSAPGGLSLVGENGPELMNVPRGAQIIPNDVLRNGGVGGGVSAPVSVNIDARGADAAGLARLETQISQLKAELPTRVVAAVKDAKARRVLA